MINTIGNRIIPKIEIGIRRLILKLPERTLLILICILIGIVAGISAFLLKSLLEYVHYFIHLFSGQQVSNILLVTLPIVGLFLTVAYISIFHRKGLKKGISQILDSIRNKSSIIEPNQTYGHIISSSFTIGFGGSAGFEAPIVATGSAIGSNIARFFKIPVNERAILLASGAAAGISAIYNAPVAGVLFAVEVLLVNMSVNAFIPLLLASATAAIVSRILFQGQLFVLITNHWNLNAIPVYIILGVLAGLYSVLIIRQSIKINKVFEKISNKWMRVGIGSIILSSLIFIFPSLFGEGYFSIQAILNHEDISILNDSFLKIGNNFIFLPLLILLFVKIYATGITISAGGNGGIFAPSLFMGAFLGYLISTTLNSTGLTELNVVNFTVVGMAGVLSGVIKIPLTAVFLIAEITGGYVLFVPLMIVSATSYFISSYFEHKSIYTKELELKA
jgi:chloride channel protein, CIC family